MSNKRNFSKNVPNWQPTPEDYRLVFREVDGLWVEISGNLPSLGNITLADYLSQIGIEVPDGCTFCRVKRDWWCWEYRDNGSHIRIDFNAIH